MLDLTARLLDARGAAAILVTHSPREAARLATRALRLEGRPARLVAGLGGRNPEISDD
jgi:ABC-type nitrate/sulfonate/bicarbonate transport system ATPase subunit